MKRNKYNVENNDYNAQKYWDERHKKHGAETLKGVGNDSMTENENHSSYESAKNIFLGIIKKLNINKSNGKILELGYGTGFYSNLLHSAEYKNYFGVDISDIHLEKLENKYPNYKGKFSKVDIGTKYFECKDCELIFMIDVSQHIVNDKKLIFALQQNVKQNLIDEGVFVVTDELSNEKFSFYEVSRTIDFYQNALGLQLLHKPRQFRDKYIFSFVNTKE